MELENHTRYPAILVRTGIDEDNMAAALVVRTTFDISPNGISSLSDEQKWLVSTSPSEGPQGPMESDEILYRGGVDLFIFGFARPPVGRVVGQIELCVRVGSEFERRFTVFGRRVWERSGSQLIAGKPEPIVKVSLGPESAFGGEDLWDELPIPYSQNPRGMGYYLTAESAEGGPLPSLECPDCPVLNWDDKPEPVWLSPCPLSAGPRLENGFDFNPENGEITRLKPELFNAAHPRMIVPHVNPGDEIVIAGVQESGLLRFRIPDLGLETRFQFDSEIFSRSLKVDQIGIEVEERRVFITWRYHCRYPFYPMQKRSCELRVK